MKTMNCLALVLVLPLMALALEPPTPVSPEPGTKGLNRTVELVVGCPIEVEELNFRVFSTVGEGEKPFAEIYTNQFQWLAPWGFTRTPGETGFEPGQTYFWTCRARIGEEWSAFFEPLWYFSIVKSEPPVDAPGQPEPRMPPAPPIPVSPEPGKKTMEPNITLVVAAPAGMDLFHFQVFKVEEGIQQPQPRWETYTTECFWKIPMMPPIELGMYRWSCRVYDGVAWSRWFEPSWTFELGKLPELTANQGWRNENESSALTLAQNPCGVSGTEISLNLARGGQVSVEVYSATGRMVKRLLTCCRAEPGTYCVAWDGTDETGRLVGAGTYLCRVQTDDLHQVVKLVKSR